MFGPGTVLFLCEKSMRCQYVKMTHSAYAQQSFFGINFQKNVNNANCHFFPR